MNKNKLILESVRSREIVHEILNFGVNQNQIKTIIKLLSLELEDRKMMEEISNIIKDEENDNSNNIKPKIQI